MYTFSLNIIESLTPMQSAILILLTRKLNVHYALKHVLKLIKAIPLPPCRREVGEEV
jgi:hypothetical protein